MTEDDLINLQKLTGRYPQPWSLPPMEPDHILYAQAMERLWPELTAKPDPMSDAQMYADALDALGGADPTSSGADRPMGAGTSPSQGIHRYYDANAVSAPGAGAQYAMGSPANVDLPWQTMADANTPPPPPAAPKLAANPPVTPSPVQTNIDPIPGYDETGGYAWRKANDQIFLDAVNRYNTVNGYRSGDDGYWTADMLKAQAMVESGGNRYVFATDPLQVNTSHNWDPKNKPPITGLTSPHQAMTPEISADAALKWLQFKARPRDHSGQPTAYIGDLGALWRYSGDSKPRYKYTKNPNDIGIAEQDWYAMQVLRLAEEAAKSRGLTPGRD